MYEHYIHLYYMGACGSKPCVKEETEEEKKPTYNGRIFEKFN